MNVNPAEHCRFIITFVFEDIEGLMKVECMPMLDKAVIWLPVSIFSEGMVVMV